MEKLTKLQLDNNIICEIRNLESLVNLKWLDLSFNSIEVIQGLDACTKITDLSFYSNHIKSIAGLEKLTDLNVLSIGKNRLSNLDESIKYLRGINNKLEVLKIAGNNFQQRGEKDYSKYAIAHLKSLKYLDYELITSTHRAEANEEHKEEMQDRD
jgi:Leucine-rich repeat (LRR) protein